MTQQKCCALDFWICPFYLVVDVDMQKEREMEREMELESLDINQ